MVWMKLKMWPTKIIIIILLLFITSVTANRKNHCCYFCDWNFKDITSTNTKNP